MTIFSWFAQPLRAMALLLFFCNGFAPTLAQQRDRGTPELMRALAQGGYVIYFRHGHTHWQQKTIEESMIMEGRHDLANCATQRNLDDIGRNDAARIHVALQVLRVPVGKVLGSLYCRPSEYVGLITAKTPVRTQWLTGLSTPETLKEFKREVATPPAPGTNTFLGGHGDRPFDLTGLIIQEGDALVFDARNHKADDAGKFKPVAWIKPAEWPALAGLAAAGAAAESGAGAATTAPVIAAVTIKQATRHDDANIRASLPPLQTGVALDRAALARSVQLARENPSKNLEVLLTPVAGAGAAAGAGSAPNAANAIVAVSDVKPWSLTAGITNTSTGTTNSRRERILLGGEHVNLWNRDHQIAAQLSGASADWDRTGNTSVAYRAPIYALGGMLGVTATRARDGGGLDADLNPITGSGRSAGIYWRQHLTPRADYHHTLTVALDDRQWFGSGGVAPFAVPITAPRVRSRPLSLRYAASWQENWVGWKFGVGLASNLSGGADNSDAAYALARTNAGHNWNALRADAEWMRILTYDIRLMLRGRAQVSNQALLPGEQFALGGALQPWGSAFGVWPRGPWIGTGGVRGVPERALTGDSGAQGSVELWSRRIGGHDLRVGGFADLGTVRRVSPAAGVSANVSAASLGALLHYQLRGNVALSLSAAQVLRGGEVVANRSGRVDLALIVRY